MRSQQCVRSLVRNLLLAAVLATLVGFAAASRASGLEAQFSAIDGTAVCGEIEAGAHWVLSGSPYHVTCSAEVIEGAVLTVAHVRKCLDGLVPALATGNTPETGNLICQELLSRWINELRVGPKG